MKIIYLLSEFSGLEKVLDEKRWVPTGVPTIHKIIEYTNRYHDINLVILSKRISRRTSAFTIKGLKNKILILRNNFKNILRPLMFIFNIFRVLIFLKKKKPDILYVDRANLFFATVFCRIFKYKVILRLMGIYPDMIELENRFNINSLIQKFCYKSKFSAIICTEDGSPGRIWMKKFINKIPKFLLIGGYDQQEDKIIEKKIKSKIKVLFLGRLEENKGCLEFIDSAIDLAKNYPSRFHFYVIGKGSLEKKITKEIKNNNLEKHFTLKKNILHKNLYKIYNEIDIYVSLNKLGSLSNSNIEAFSFNKCTIILESDNEKQIDLSTENIIPKDFVIRISRKNIRSDLKKQLLKLSHNKSLINQYENNIKKKFKTIFPTWDDRVRKEVNIIKNCITKK